MARRHLRVAHGHGLARLPRAELRDGAVLQVDVVEERRGCKRGGAGVAATSDAACARGTALGPRTLGQPHFPQTRDEGPGARHGPGVLACSPRTEGGAHGPSQREARAPLLPTPAGSGAPLGSLPGARPPRRTSSLRGSATRAGDLVWHSEPLARACTVGGVTAAAPSTGHGLPTTTPPSQLPAGAGAPAPTAGRTHTESPAQGWPPAPPLPADSCVSPMGPAQAWATRQHALHQGSSGDPQELDGVEVARPAPRATHCCWPATR